MLSGHRSTFFYLMRCVPVSCSQTKMEYEVFRHKDASDEAFTSISELFKQVLREDKDLCNAAQTNLNAGIFTNGALHPQAEKVSYIHLYLQSFVVCFIFPGVSSYLHLNMMQGPLYFQQVVRKLLFEHRREEEKTGKQIWPAVPEHVATDKVEEELNFCRSLDCSSAGSSLDW